VLNFQLMYSFFVCLIAFCLVCCKKPTEPFSTDLSLTESTTEIGKKLFHGKGQCATCHKTNQNILGPSVSEIVLAYQNQKNEMIQFLKGKSDPIVDPSQFQIMKVNLEITKKMTEKELQSLVDYIYDITEE